MKIIKSVFEKSSSKISECPKGNLPEFALVGRSNVGKSSLINTLLNKKSIAKTSSKPGKTLLINHFKINDKLYFVDLPGYGYAKASKQIIKEIKLIHESYFKTRKQLLFTFLLIDIRHDLQKVDLEFMKYLNSMMCPFVIVFTKWASSQHMHNLMLGQKQSFDIGGETTFKVDLDWNKRLVPSQQPSLVIETS